MDIFKKTNFCVIPVMWDGFQSLISRAFEERQYGRAYLKQMHELLKDYSERTLTVRVYHTPAIVQLRKSPDE